jgi:hypothetical protein
MAPGRDCMECHASGGEARRWTASGTWTRGANVTVTDATGRTVTMRGNKVGNFYTAESLTPPLTVVVDGQEMPATALVTAEWPSGRLGYGGCNLCHGGPNEIADWALSAPLMAPGRDCLPCHDGAMALKFTVAGTWPPAQKPGPVVVVDAGGATVTMTRNAAGNFFTTQPLQFPLRRVSVGGSDMSPPPGYGGCNACHRNGEADD